MSLITQFQAYLLTERHVAKNTFSAYKRDLDQFIAFLQHKSLTLETMHDRTLKDFLAFIKGQGISARSMARKISALKLFFSYVHEYHGMINYSEEIGVPKLEKKLPTFLTEQEIEQLLVSTEDNTSYQGKRNKVLLYLLYVSGMRISELIMLKLADIHFENGMLKVFGKREKERFIPLPEIMLSMLKDYTQTLHRTFTQKDNGNRKTDYLFPTLYGGKIKPITRQACWIILKNLWAQTGSTKSISPHTLRHSLATHMLKNGADIRALQLILGHQKVTTVQVYTHVETSHLRAIYDKKHPRSE